MPADHELMERVRDGDVRLTSLLFDRHHRKLFLYFYRLTGDRGMSEDLVQDVFFRILKYRHTYQGGKEFGAWMYRIARNAYQDMMQKHANERLLDDEAGRFSESIASADGSPVEALMKAESVSLLRKALDSLPDERRELLVLARFQGLKYEEIADILGCEVGTVKVRVFRAVRDLAKVYNQMTGERVS